MNDYELGWNAGIDTAISALRSPLLKRDIKLDEIASYLFNMKVCAPPLTFGERNYCPHGVALADACELCVTK